MRAQAISQRAGVGVRVNVRENVRELDWFQRLVEWFRSFGYEPQLTEPMSPYGTWDARREQFSQMKSDAAVDLVAARHGISWASKIYSASI
jgi:hypothetical protein